MVDFVLFVFTCFVYGTGFWCGQKFGTVSNMVAAGKAQVKGWVNKT